MKLVGKKYNYEQNVENFYSYNYALNFAALEMLAGLEAKEEMLIYDAS